MMSKYLITLPAVAAFLLTTACSSDDNLTDGTDELVEIRLTSSLEAQTRATHGLDQQIAEGETVHVWVDDAGTDGSLYTDNALTADGNGGLSGGTTMYFPSTGNAVDIYAIHGNLSSTSSFWGETLTHTVAQDQQSTTTGYATSDLVYCKSTDVARTTNAVNLTFNHLLSKVEVVLKQGNGAPSIDKVELLNTQLDATFMPDKSSDGVTVEASGDAGAIVIDNDVTTADAEEALNEAVIVPQTLASGTKFIRITTTDGGVLAYSLPADITFAAGKKYHYTITVNLTELIVTTSITDWVDGETIQDNASMDDDYTYTEENGVRTYTVYSEAGLLEWSEYTRDGNRSTNCTLANDITLTEEWTVVGDNYSKSYRYTGTFDGNGYTITGLTINASSSYQGLIGYLGSGGEVKNLTLAEVNISSEDGENIGAVVGYNRGSVTACHVSGTTNGFDVIGGVVGRNSGTIAACHSTASVSGGRQIGGVVGFNFGGTVTACYASGTVNGVALTGGVVGDNSGTVIACYWYNSTTTYGIGDPESDDNATKVEGSVTWADAASAMNAVLTGWQYVENNDDNEPLTLEATE